MIPQNDSRAIREAMHRASNEFPTGEQCELTCMDVPDDESGFKTMGHYCDRKAERTDPPITDEIIDRLLNWSVVTRDTRDWENPRYLFQDEINGYEWTLVVADDRPGKSHRRRPVPGDRYALITVYSNYHGSVGTTNKYFDRKFGSDSR